MSATDRELFCSVLSNSSLRRADAVVVLCGEDAEVRADIAFQLFRQNAAPLFVLSGGRDDPPRYLGANSVAPLLIGKGVAPDRLLLETTSQHTGEQAAGVLALAVDRGWTGLLLIASSYHQYRAFLTFLAAIRRAGKANDIRLGVMAASQSAWWGSPPGDDRTRAELLGEEFVKVDRYQGDVATYAEGLAYLQHWEGK